MLRTGLEGIKTATVSQQQAADAMGVDQRLISRAVQEGSIPTIKLGARKRILRIPLMRMLSEGVRKEDLSVR